MTATTDPDAGMVMSDPQFGVGQSAFQNPDPLLGFDILDHSFAAAWGDVNRDGHLDLYVATHDGGQGCPGRRSRWPARRARHVLDQQRRRHVPRHHGQRSVDEQLAVDRRLRGRGRGLAATARSTSIARHRARRTSRRASSAAATESASRTSTTTSGRTCWSRTGAATRSRGRCSTATWGSTRSATGRGSR